MIEFLVLTLDSGVGHGINICQKEGLEIVLTYFPLFNKAVGPGTKIQN
jgi:hypothetical protein